MKLKFIRRLAVVLICVLIVSAGSISAYALYQDNAYDYAINGISIKVNGNYSEAIPSVDFSAEVSVSSKTDTSSVMVLLAAYSEKGQMLCAQYQNVLIGANETITCMFDVKNADGEISALKVFLLDSTQELIPVAAAYSLSNLDTIVSAYLNSSNELVVRTFNGNEMVVNQTVQCGLSFSDYAVGAKFYLEYPKGEFDVPVTVNGSTYQVHICEVYYELTSINDISDTEAWSANDYSRWGESYFTRYNLVMHIEAETDAVLAGSSVRFYFSDNCMRPDFSGMVGSDGSISICEEINQGGGQYWFAPRALYFWSINLTPSSSS